VKQSLTHKLFLKIDSQIPLFNKFYDQLLKSEAIKDAPASLSETGELSYNLLSTQDHEELKSFLLTCEKGTLLEFGCGLSPVSQILQNEGINKIDVLGLDFSDRVIERNKELFSEHLFLQAHQHFLPSEEFDYLVLTDALYQGSRRKPFLSVINELFSKCRRKAIVIQNHRVDNLPELYPAGIPQKDSTDSFYQHVKSWMDFLQTTKVQSEREKFKLLWDTISNEMGHHWNLLEQQKLKRIITLYENPNSSS
jgi:SAM-dependent methyltransferase